LRAVLGVRLGLAHFLGRLTGIHRRKPYVLQPAGLLHPIEARPFSSDLYVYKQIFLEEEYAPLRGLEGVGLIIDCGANVGYSSAWFLSEYPGARLVAVEPDPTNFAMLERNLAPYGDRARVVRAGIWSHTAPLVMAETEFGDGLEWSRQVRPCRAGEVADFEGVSIESLREESGFERISILKVDIEGAEVVVFREETGWLDRVDALAIELHEESMFGRASEVFPAVVEGRGFTISRSGELTLCVRRGEQLAEA
jgi:FkbM family methyltransferase